MCEILTYEQTRQAVENFTVINCENNKWPYNLIGHTAGIRKLDDSPVNVQESTSLNKWSGRTGVQEHPLSTWLKNYNGKVWFRLYHGIITAETMALDAEFFRLTYGLPYPNTSSADGLWKLTCSAVDVEIDGVDIITYKGDDAGIFCTQLYMARLSYCGLCKDLASGLLPESLEFGKEFEPDDLREGGKAENAITGEFGKEQRIK